MKILRKTNNNDALSGVNIGVTSGYNLAKMNLESLKAMSKAGLNVNDWQYVPLVEEYVNMSRMNIKRESIRAMLAERYGISVSSVKRIVRRMLKQVKF